MDIMFWLVCSSSSFILGEKKIIQKFNDKISQESWLPVPARYFSHAKHLNTSSYLCEASLSPCLCFPSLNVHTSVGQFQI